MASPFEPHNPYLAPRGPAAPYGAAAASRLPGYAKAMAIVDLVFCILRTISLLFSVAGYFVLARQQNPLVETAVAEIATGLCIAAFGIPANILILLRKPTGLWLAMVAVAGTIGSMGVAVWQASLQADQFAPGTPQRVGYFIGVAFISLLRLGLLGLYIGGLVQFANWSRRHRPNPTMF